MKSWSFPYKKQLLDFMRTHWIATLLILLVTLIFFAPIVARIDSYSEGGDAMFNAWTLARNQHCILQQDCPSYVDGNIFYPRQDTMLYSETQLSAGLLTLPLYFINDNPIFSYNVFTILSFFFMAWFMYLLAWYLSKRHLVISILAGLLFAYAPFRMPALSHLQNSSIFYLPLIVLMILKFFDTKNRNYLIGLFISSVLLFYASWYQMAFALIAIGILLAGFLILKLQRPKQVLIVSAAILLALLSVYPLAKEYMRFSKTNDATFSIKNQTDYSASLIDYITPEEGTLLGKITYGMSPDSHRNSYNPDSYSYYGIILTVIAGGTIYMAYRYRKRGKQASQHYKLAVIFGVIALVGFIISLGPLLKIRQDYIYQDVAQGLNYVIPLPWLLVDTFLPQLAFIRALGRAGVLILFAFCCLLAFAPMYAAKFSTYNAHRRLIGTIAIALIAFELMPLHVMPMRQTAYNYNMSVPAVYEFIKERPEINNIVILSADWDYPGTGGLPVKLPEQVLWAGYHNRNIFNGYSGYLPPTYYEEFYNYVDFGKEDIARLKHDKLEYVMVDKLLSTSNPDLADQVADTLGKDHKIYEDKRYALFRAF